MPDRRLYRIWWLDDDGMPDIGIPLEDTADPGITDGVIVELDVMPVVVLDIPADIDG